MGTAYDKVMEERRELVNLLTDQMKKGYSFTKSMWNKSIFRPNNPVSNVRYHGGNRLKLMLVGEMQKYNDPRWCTFKQADSMGWKIKAGSRGVLLEKWVFTKEVPAIDSDGKQKLDSQGKPLKETVELERPYVNYFRVFNATQMEGIPELELDLRKVNADDLYKLSNDMISSSRCPIYQERITEAFYRPGEDAIHLPVREIFKNNESFLSVLLHEMAHSTGHGSRLDRPMKNSFGSIEYAKEELNAEIASFFMQADLGLELALDSEIMKDHANYVNSWIEMLQENPNELFIACANADKISAYLISNYEHYITQEKNHSQYQDQKAVDPEKIKMELQKNGFRSKSAVVKAVKEYQCLTGVQSLKEIADQFKKNPYPVESREHELLQKIGAALSLQEMERTAMFVLER